MRVGAVLLLLSLLLLTAGVDDPDPPTSFELEQNVPNPFCPGGTSGDTEIRMALPQEAHILLEVWSQDTTVVVRTLFDQVGAPGYHGVRWDGRDGGGAVLPDGDYPYTMTATEVGSGTPLGDSLLVATIDCTVPTEPTGWSGIKFRFGK
jgi:hypothetical protein